MKLTDVKVVTAWKKTSMGFYFHLLSLSVAETHAGDDRTDAGTDEDEVGRLKGSEVKGSTVTQATSTHIYIKHTHTCIHLVVQPCHSAGPPGAIFQNHIIYVHTTTTSSSSSLHSSIHRLFGSSVSSRLHIQTSLLVGVGKKKKQVMTTMFEYWVIIIYLLFSLLSCYPQRWQWQRYRAVLPSHTCLHNIQTVSFASQVKTLQCIIFHLFCYWVWTHSLKGTNSLLLVFSVGYSSLTHHLHLWITISACLLQPDNAIIIITTEIDTCGKPNLVFLNVLD